MKTFFICVSMILFFGTSRCEVDVADKFQQLQEQFGQSISLDELQNALQTKCEKNGGSDALDKLKASANQLKTCVETNFNFTVIQEQIALKRKTGDLDEVFEEYCAKVPTLMECVKVTAGVVENCLEASEKDSLKMALNLTNILADFVCFKGGDRIALFIAEKGPECIQEQQSALERCANETFAPLIPSEFSLNNLPLLSLNTDGCQDFLKMQTCAVEALQNCEDSTTANLTDALFRFIRKMSPCKK